MLLALGVVLLRILRMAACVAKSGCAKSVRGPYIRYRVYPVLLLHDSLDNTTMETQYEAHNVKNKIPA